MFSVESLKFRNMNRSTLEERVEIIEFYYGNGASRNWDLTSLDSCGDMCKIVFTRESSKSWAIEHQYPWSNGHDFAVNVRKSFEITLKELRLVGSCKQI